MLGLRIGLLMTLLSITLLTPVNSPGFSLSTTTSRANSQQASALRHTSSQASSTNWLSLDNLNLQRASHTATLLSDGRVLVAGGTGTARNSAEAYDPSIVTWWAYPAMLNIGREAHTATLLRDGTVLIAGGQDDFGVLASAEIYHPDTNTWTPTGAMNTGRAWHTATLLPSGTVLVVGGHSNTDTLSSAEVYNPATHLWSVVGNMATAREHHAAVLLADNTVLVMGGIAGSSTTATTEIYNPERGAWSTTTSLTVARSGHTATVLADGRVLVAGGHNTATKSITSSAEIFDPIGRVWKSTSALSVARYGHTATLLPNGSVIITGGVVEDGSTTTSTEAYSPTSGVWTTAGTLKEGRAEHTATLLPSGEVLVTGGRSSASGSATVLASSELFVPLADSWFSSSPMVTARGFPNATLLANGKVLVIGGLGTASAELYDSDANAFSSAGSMSRVRVGHTVTLLINGKVLVTGGQDENAQSIASAEIYDIATNKWSNTGAMSTTRFRHTATLLPDGKVLVAGGDNSHQALASAEIYDPDTGTWTVTGSMANARADATATLLLDGTVLVTGGDDPRNASTGSLSSAEIYNPAAGTWSLTGSMKMPRANHTATLLPNGRVLVTGGSFSGAIFASSEFYDPDPVRHQWYSAGNMSIDRSSHAAALLPNGNVLVVGGHHSGAGGEQSADIYVPAANTWIKAGNLAAARTGLALTLLLDGSVLAIGGESYYGGQSLASTERYYFESSTLTSSRPHITNITSRLTPGDILHVDGQGFEGISEASSGNTQSSATNYPLVQLRSLANEQIRWILVDRGTSSSTSITGISPARFPPGYALATVFSNGVASRSQPLLVTRPIEISPMGDQTVLENTSTDALHFTLTTKQVSLDSLDVKAESSNQKLIPNNNILLSGNGADRTITIFPSHTNAVMAPTQQGNATITIRATDGTNVAVMRFTVTVTPPPWLVLLYLAGDDSTPIRGQGAFESLSYPIKALVNRFSAGTQYNPNMRLVILYDGNDSLTDKGFGDSRIYVRDPEGLTNVTPELIQPGSPWTGFPANSELDTGNPATLRSFVSWARATYPNERYSFLSIVDHGGGWAPAFDDPPGQPSGGRAQAGGWRGMSLDMTSGGTSLATRDTGYALQDLPKFDILFFDACLMGMIESAYEVRNLADYLIAGQNLLFADLPYEKYFSSSHLSLTTEPDELAKAIVQNYNFSSYVPKPFTIASLDLTQLHNTDSLAQKVNVLAETLLSHLPDSPVPISDPVRAALTEAYASTQKFDYDSSLTLDPTDGYVDLADFVHQIQISADPVITSDIRIAAGDVITSVKRMVVQQQVVNGVFREKTWNFTNANGISIYLPLGEKDNRPTFVRYPGATPQPERQLHYYSNCDFTPGPSGCGQLAFTSPGAAPQWAQLLLRLEQNTPERDLAQRPFNTPYLLQSFQRLYLPIIQ